MTPLQLKDITISVSDSCNCWDCCTEDDPLVYVNSHGQVEKFDPQKAHDQREAMRRSIEHLTSLLEDLKGQNPAQVHLIKEAAQNEPITLSLIQRIKKAVGLECSQ